MEQMEREERKKEQMTGMEEGKKPEILEEGTQKEVQEKAQKKAQEEVQGEVQKESQEESQEKAQEEVQDEAQQAAVEGAGSQEAPAESMEDYSAELEASFRKIGEGDIISGTVIDVSEDGVILDLRYYTQGVIRAEDMSDSPDFSILRDVKNGDILEASVVRMDDGQGNILLSRKSANQVLAWDKLKQYMEEETVLEVKIGGVTNGGAIAYVEDIRGFIPASQLSLDYVEDVNPWLGKVIRVRVITVDQEKNKLVLSAKGILKEEAREAHDRKVSMIVPGSVLEGTVESLMPYGAFVNLGEGLSGLVHISQISQKRLKKPSEVLTVGDKVKAKVLNTNNGKISLSMKALLEDMEAEEIADFDFQSEGSATTSLGSLLAGIKLD